MRGYFAIITLLVGLVADFAPAIAADTPDAAVRGWCGLKSSLPLVRAAKEKLSEEEALAIWNNVVSDLDSRKFSAAFQANDRLLADPAKLEGLLIGDATTKPDEVRPFPLLWVARRIDVLKGLRNNDQNYALRGACLSLSAIEAASRNEEDKFDLNIELFKIGGLFASRKMYREKESLFRYGLYLLNHEVPTRCMSVFIGRTLCDGLVDSLFNQQKYAEAATHVSTWLAAIESDVGNDSPDYLLALPRAAEILTKNPNKGLVVDFDGRLVHFSRETLGKTANGQWLSFAKDLAQTHFTLATYWEHVDSEKAKNQFAMGAAWATRLVLGLNGLPATDPGRAQLGDALNIAEYFNNEAGPLINRGIVFEWRRRKLFIEGTGSREALVREQATVRPAGEGFIQFRDGLIAVNDIIARPSKEGDTDEITAALFAAFVADEDRLQGRYQNDAVESRIIYAHYLAWSGNVEAALGEGDDILGRIRKLSELDLAGWETWQRHLTNRLTFLTWYRGLAIDRFNENQTANLDSFQRAFFASQMIEQSRVSWTLSASLARSGTTDPELAEVLKTHAALYDKLVANEVCLLSREGCGTTEGQLSPAQEAFRTRKLLIEDMESSAAAIKKKFPKYASLATPQIFEPDKAKAALAADEVLINVDVNEDGGAVLVLSAQPKAKQLTTREFADIAGLVRILRCGVDKDFWFSQGSNCEQAVGKRIRASLIRPFSIDAAYRLYRIVFGDVDTGLVGKKLLVQSSGVLASLPLQILVTKPPVQAFVERLEDYRDVAWLGAAHSISLVTSVGNLLELRNATQSVASSPQKGGVTKRYVGFGNPLLNGEDNEAAAEEARQGQSCAEPSKLAAVLGGQRGPGLPSVNKIFSGASVNLDELRKLQPLPETADEVCQTGAAFGATPSDIFLGGRDTETAIKTISESRQLQEYRIVHFATHALVSSETHRYSGKLIEPALVFTPPSTVTAMDDGLLTSSEISDLHLDADFVVLSACNTATGDHGESEALSGLARAFFASGARAVMVSHWPVDSSSGKLLTTAAMQHYAESPLEGRARALEYAIREMINGPDPATAHPLSWAPFSVVTAD
jgi:CHAT domain-containing protein